MKKLSKAAAMFAVIAVILFMTVAVRAQHVFVKDGQIYQGKVAADNKDGITLILQDGKKKLIPRGEILRVLYSDEYLTKSLIQLASGETFEGFIVNETRENYTIRKKLNEPDEKVIGKGDIARTDKKRPSKLTGRVTDKGIHLVWNKPLGSFKMFIVYIKKKGEEYRAVDRVNKAGLLVARYEPDTEYSFMVRMVDSDNYESPPSNEVTVKTLKIGEKAPEFKGDEKAIAGIETAKKESNVFSLGIGVFGTGGISMQYWNKKNNNVGNGGGGIMLDTAVARDSLQNYRFTLSFENDYGFRYRKMPYFYSIPMSAFGYTMPLILTEYYKSKQLINPVSLSMSHAFGYGLVRTRWVRFWLGPELAFSLSMKGAEKLIGGYVGIGLVIGLNINLGDLVSLSITESTRVGYAVQSTRYSTLKVRALDTTGVPGAPVIPLYPVKKQKSLENGLNIGGQLNFAVLFRINDRYSGN